MLGGEEREPMALTWNREPAPQWDADKRRVVGAAPPRVFPSLEGLSDGELVGGDWWRVERDGTPVGYGWMDVTWGDAEILLAVDPGAQQAGVGTWILDHLDSEAADRGVRYLYNVVPEAHPEPAELTAWLRKRGFEPSGEEGGLLRRKVAHEGVAD
jgi:GNAT superfamily N-acetyltransferase